MSAELPPAVWNEIIRASIYLPQELDSHVGRFIGIHQLQSILRKSRRSNSQNRLIWSLYEDALREGGETLGGWDREDLHEWALGTYFGWDQYNALGSKRLKPKKRSSRLSSKR